MVLALFSTPRFFNSVSTQTISDCIIFSINTAALLAELEDFETVRHT